MRDLESSAHQDLVSGEGIELVGWVGWVGLGSALKPGSQVGFAERLGRAGSSWYRSCLSLLTELVVNSVAISATLLLSLQGTTQGGPTS